MKKVMTFATAVLLAACSSTGPTVTGPTTNDVPAPVAAAPTATPAPQPVAPVTPPPEHVGTISGASFTIQNHSLTYAKYAARLYEVVNTGGEQQLRQEIISGDVGAGQSFGGTFDKLPCNYQIDLDLYFVVRNPPAPGEIAHQIVTGNVCTRIPDPQPTPTPDPSPDPTPSPSPSPSPDPDPAYCYYEVTKKPDEKREKCEHEGGVWGAWYSEQGHDHEQCRFEFPGISSKYFNLNPGQSVDGCLSKRDDD